MQYTIITTETEWDALASEWDQLLSTSIMQVPFLNHSYLRAWWKTLGGGEWSREKSQLQIITARENERLVGIAPLFLCSREGFEPALRFIGSLEVSDYLDFIVESKNLEAFLSGLLKFLIEAPHILSKKLDLFNVVDQSPTTSVMKATCDNSGWSYQVDVLQPAPYITLSDTFEGYLAGLSKKQRHEIRRKVRNAETRHITDWFFVENSERLNREMDRFISMMRRDPQKNTFLTDLMVEHLHKTARLFFDQGTLHLSFLTMEGHKTAAYFSIRCNEKLLVYNSAWEPLFAPCSPGWVLLAKLIEWSISQGIRELDMMRGNEIYKYRFGAMDRFVMRITLSPIEKKEI